MIANSKGRDVQGSFVRTGWDEMLELTRKPGQSIVIGGLSGELPLATITVLDIHQGRVVLGFTASKGVPIHRMEIWTSLPARSESSNAILDERKAVISDSADR
jgi:carbon storage regulator CsrA